MKAGYKVVGICKETGSGAADDRAQRKKILQIPVLCFTH
jgi:hypothetical protein